MSDDRTQPGCKVSTEEYQRFKQFVEDAHGSVRGNLGRELERAMREYRTSDDADRLARVEDDVAQIKAIVADEAAVNDGGTPSPTVPSGEDTDTHTGDTGGGVMSPDDRPPVPDKPDPKASRAAKVRYLTALVRERAAPDPSEPIQAQQFRARETGTGLEERSLAALIREEYGFTEELVEDYRDAVVDRLGAEPHPDHGEMWVWGQRLRWEQERAREADQKAADDRLDALDTAARE